MTTAGLGSWVGWAQESTWGTAVARTKYYPLLSSGDNLGNEIEKVMGTDIEFAQTDVGKVYEGQETIRGSFQIELGYTGLLRLWEHITGHTPSPTGAGPFTWTFFPLITGTPNTLGEGLSIEILRGGQSANSFLYEGCKLTKLTINATANSVATGTFEFVAETVTTVAKSTPGSVGVNDLIRQPTGQASPAFCLIGGTARNCKSVTFTVDSKYEPRHTLDSFLTLEPYRTGKQEATLQLELEFQDLNQFNDFIALTSRVVQVEWNQAANANFRITMDNAILMTGATPFINSMGIITYTPTFRGFFSSPDQEYKLRLINDEASIT